MTSTPELERIELIEAEQVVARGTRRTDWYVRHNAGWVRAREIAEATVTSLAPPPGTVWQRAIALRIARGTRVLCVQTAPKSQMGNTPSPLSYLEKGRTDNRPQVRRVEYFVGRGGQLERAAKGP